MKFDFQLLSTNYELANGDYSNCQKSIDISKTDLKSSMSDIISALTNIDGFVSDSVHLIVRCEQGQKYLSSNYDKRTGMFEDWRGDPDLLSLSRSNPMKRLIDLTRFNLNGLIVEARDYFGHYEDLEEYPLNDYYLITSKGEKPIFGYDRKNFYTSCGLSAPVRVASLREKIQCWSLFEIIDR